MTHILVDVDNTICDFTGAVCREASTILDRRVDSSEITQWNLRAALNLTSKQIKALYSAIHRKDFCLSLEPLPGAVTAVKKLRSLAFVSFVTSPWDTSSYWMWERAQWLRTFFEADPIDIVHTHKKWCVNGDVIIDDRPSNVTFGERKLRILIPTPANKNWRFNEVTSDIAVFPGVKVIKSWPSIIRVVKDLVEHG